MEILWFASVVFATVIITVIIPLAAVGRVNFPAAWRFGKEYWLWRFAAAWAWVKRRRVGRVSLWPNGPVVSNIDGVWDTVVHGVPTMEHAKAITAALNEADRGGWPSWDYMLQAGGSRYRVFRLAPGKLNLAQVERVVRGILGVPIC